jgi:hypothetical protein
MMPRGIYLADVSYLYEKSPSSLTAITSTTDIPREFSRYPIEMALAHIFRIKRKRSDMPTSMELAEMALQNALNYDSIESSSNRINA